jgi:hypothetical protein
VEKFWRQFHREEVYEPMHGMDSSPLVRPRHISIYVRPIQNFFMSAVDVRFQLVHRGWRGCGGGEARRGRQAQDRWKSTTLGRWHRSA